MSAARVRVLHSINYFLTLFRLRQVGSNILMDFVHSSSTKLHPATAACISLGILNANKQSASYSFTGRMRRHFSIIIEFGCKTEYQPHLIDIGLFGNSPSRPQTIAHFRFRSHDRRALGANNYGDMRGHR
jgi:hypothetical protein